MILTSREGRTTYRNATLQWSQDGKSLRLSGSDGAGGQWHLDGLHPGQYTVRLVMENNEDRLKSVLDRPGKHAIDPKNAPFWIGKVTTKDLAVEITPPARQRLIPGS